MTPSPPLRKKQRRLPPPHTFERLYSSYQWEWEARKQSMPRHADILDLLWKDDDENGTYLIGCTSLGQVAVWKMDDNINIEEDSMNTKPMVTLDVSSKALRSIQIANNIDNSLWLFLAGDEGLWTMKWEDLLAKKAAAPTKILMDGAFQQVQVYLNHVYILTNNSTVLKVDSKTHQIVARYPPPSGDHDVSATTFKVVKGSSSSSSTNSNGGSLLLVGTTNSQVWIWDVTKNKALEPLHLLKNRHNKNHKNSKAKNAAASSCTVTSICTNNENDLWWTIAGTLHTNCTNPQAAAEGGGGGGFISTWHGPTRSFLTRCDTQESIHRLALSQNNGALYSAANHGVVSVWESPHQLAEPHARRRIWVSPPSGKALATSNDDSKNNTNERVAMAGVGPKVDILEHHCRLFTLEL